MGTIHVALCQMNSLAETGETMPLALSQPDATETQATTTTSARVGTLAATERDQVWLITALGNDMYIRASAAAGSLAAGPDQGHVVPAGATVPLGVTNVGEQIAARDVA